MKQNKIIYVILSQSCDDIGIIFASFNRRKRDKVFKESYEPIENDANLFYKSQIILDKE